ncbi:hypothetical protein SCUCBS95973_009815 [Sporothrix curviconia]|uniref:Peptidase S9 prolyl oligopeptidase catalytic domain-containing protein n=1 Tax=Sporothrix curviconia TaxID=1260050 RepID=A0ABP0CY40_9PEZI
MTLRTIAPYGRWTSAISAEAATAGTRSLTSPRSSPSVNGQGYFLVSQDDGSSTVYMCSAGGDDKPPTRVLPAPWGVGTSVYEYGGQAYAVMEGGGVCKRSESNETTDKSERSEDTMADKIVFADRRDQGVHMLDVATGTVTTLVQGTPALRYGDFDVVSDNPWIVALQEDHTDPLPAAVRNYVVAIHRGTGEVVRVVEGADFYSYARWVPWFGGGEGGQTDKLALSWREWNHPDLPFEGVTLHWAVWQPETNTLSQTTQVAGEDRQCVAEAVWAPDGSSLLFGMEPKGGDFRQLFRVRRSGSSSDLSCPSLPEPVAFEGLEDAEFGDASWIIGCQTLVFLTPSTVVAVGTRYGQNHLVYADLDTGAWAALDADVGLVEMKFDPLAALSAWSFLVVGSGYTTPQAVYRVELDPDAIRQALATGSHVTPGVVSPQIPRSKQQQQQPPPKKLAATSTLLFRSTEQDFAPRLFSTPELVCIPAPGSADGKDAPHDVYGWFWPPHNRSFEAPQGTLPPLVVTPHGGPTGYTAPGLHMMAQFWATRGFAYFAINYSGSSGHGRAYRDRLWTRWGILDRDDVAAAIHYLTTETRRADARRVGIEGGSAGGYNVLQSLVGYAELFAGGVCCCGVADTAALGRDTHKLESHYLDRLLWKDGASDDEKARIHFERSPVNHAERITAPLRLIHGDQDTVVPIAQSRSIQAQIAKRGGDVDLIVLPGEGHMFVKTESLVLWLTSEAEWWEKTLLKEDGE